MMQHGVNGVPLHGLSLVATIPSSAVGYGYIWESATKLRVVIVRASLNDGFFDSHESAAEEARSVELWTLATNYLFDHPRWLQAIARSEEILERQPFSGLRARHAGLVVVPFPPPCLTVDLGRRPDREKEPDTIWTLELLPSGGIECAASEVESIQATWTRRGIPPSDEDVARELSHSWQTELRWWRGLNRQPVRPTITLAFHIPPPSALVASAPTEPGKAAAVPGEPSPQEEALNDIVLRFRNLELD
jgi:hypothetical protein